MSTKTTDILFDIARLSEDALTVLSRCNMTDQSFCDMRIARELEVANFCRVLPGEDGWDAAVETKGRRGALAAAYATELIVGRDAAVKFADIARGRSAA